MNEQLNKKLAEWADCVDGSDWYFDESLDACFKWLMPKVHKELGDKEFFKFLIRWCIKIITDGNEALALCLAIEKLIK